MESINEFTKQLCDDIKTYYINAFSKNEDGWTFICQTDMQNFVLSRNGWKKSDNSDETFIYLDKYPITVSILHSNSPGQLMIDTATEIAKAELIEKIGDDNNVENLVDEIVDSVKNQDWIIPFVRTKLD
ncbi:MAG TPA: hypothetical protein DEB09_02540 [Candidatus Magasanikbacteria bacterium]|nr:hypothetical protein [Candidatus Magasanikbacteria bacterium]